jgi:hypothetical protein
MKKSSHVMESLSDYLQGTLTTRKRSAVERHLKTCDPCRSEFKAMTSLWEELGRIPDEQPTPRVREQFYAELAAQAASRRQAAAPESRRLYPIRTLFDRLWPRQPALQVGVALACLLVGYIIGFRIDGVGKGSANDVAQLRTEVVNMQRLVMLSLMKTESASERIRGANWSERISRPDAEVYSALFEALNYDPVVNVRLAALDPLSKYYNEPEVKQGLISSLLRQTSPLVQLALIQVITTVHDADARVVLKELLKIKDLNKTVREQAEKRVNEMELEGIR